MYEAVVHGKRIGSFEDFAEMVGALFASLDKKERKFVPKRVSPQSNWTSLYYRGSTLVALPCQVWQFCLERGVTAGGKMRQGASELREEEVREFFRRSDQSNRALFGEKLLALVC